MRGRGRQHKLLLLLLVLPLQLLMMCGRQNQSGAHKDTRIVATNHVDPPPRSLPPLLPIFRSLLLSFTAFVCLARSSFFMQLRKLLSVCPLPALVCLLLLLLLFLLFHCHFSLHFSVFFGSHTHTCTLYTLVPFRILLHILPLLFLPSFACLSLLLKEAKRAKFAPH